MKIIYNLYKSYAFYINTILVLLIISIIHINDINYRFYDSIRVSQLLIIVLIALFFYLFIKRKSGWLNKFYTSDTFYCELMYITSIVGVSSTIYFINWETIDVHRAIKIWEIAAYSVTLLYTLWLWKFKIGNDIFQIIEYKKIPFWKKFRFAGAIILSLVFLFFIIIGHLFITFGNNHEVIRHYSILISIALIFITYLLFAKISSNVISLTENKLTKTKNMTNEDKKSIDLLNTKITDYNNEFKFGLRYMDRPMKWVFFIMLIYAFYVAGLDCFANKNVLLQIEVFFGGAIAFELLLSSLVWAKTETV